MSVAISACGADTASTEPAVPTQLTFLVQPTNAAAGYAFAPTMRVAIQDASGRTVTTASSAVALELGSGTSTLLGTRMVNAVAGVASFPELALERSGTAFTLVARSAALTPATSSSFSISPGSKQKLTFLLQPTGGASGAIAPALQIAVQDGFGNTVTTATDAVTIAIGTNTGAATLSGTLSVAAVQGVATFTDLRLDRPGAGYTLTASAPQLTAATSASFTSSATGLLFVAISAATKHTCAVTAAGAAYCWGGNTYGQLGDGTTTDRATPVRVLGDVGFVAVSAAWTHTCGLTAVGVVYCWGLDFFGELGDGVRSAVLRTTPVRVIGDLTFSAVHVGSYHTCGVTTAGPAYCWGANSYGQLGDGTTADRLAPVRAGPNLSFRAVSTGAIHSCGVSTSGDGYCWGGNISGMIGDGTTSDRSVPVRVSGGVSFAGLSAGFTGTCAFTPIGSAYCWGSNALGQLGDGTTTSRTTPTPVTAGPSFVGLSAGSFHTCGVTASGAAYCWGSNVLGKLGDGTQLSRASPVAVAGAYTFSSVTAGDSHTCAITRTGAAYCWGANELGQLGDGTDIPRFTPVAVSR